MLVPSIDLFDGKAVQWRQGREHVLEREDVFDLLTSFSMYGEVAVIDLNAATGKGSNRELIERMLNVRSFRVGGGIRDLETARAYLKAGASRLILGTAARQDWVKKLPREALIFAIDSKGDQLVDQGWQSATGEKTEDVLQEMGSRCSALLYTQVEKEGMMQGLDRERVERIVKASPVPVTVAGGITTVDDIKYLNELGASGQIGMALYTGKLTLEDCMLARCNFEKAPLIPTVVQDADSGDVLMTAYSNRESLEVALRERRGVYWSRSRQKLWRKGESSGHVQALQRVDIDCDGDTLLFQIRQTGNACHFDRWSCFPTVNQRWRLENLDAVLADRREKMPEGSYTAKLFSDADLQAEKLREETEELLEAETFEDVRWEAADLIYFALVSARARGVGLEDIISELRSRHGNA
ncbi:bifunctional phosphoribosyl-AMP cyclohydrolase/phosphoribosyl-ATP diphosphatase HisIE [Acanthopleuribacter pedis]|uniref:Histidine biosynthesis bifunctional protein HisIE n=1 Tax=Acanthopleuribacter pedis TaxID=442870 RepID=A0A8J7U593_9BACT|nr:bifunctional phosphoribosyl-AMP cyclohydrolase/phosphoribosyl-ATP diphosphatase HisIE [Acanthopleuribacter pedis]MBO1320233.1 bifunctional phosphoribosyl-AMP cyclohydrolase/phosphoribosyl-ATP diphosphatase HisIE [Acanthopleuribacter pedis]